MFARIRALHRKPDHFDDHDARLTIRGLLADLRLTMDADQPIGLRHDRGPSHSLTPPSAFAAKPWQVVLCSTPLMLAAMIVALQARPVLWSAPTTETRTVARHEGYLNAAQDTLQMAVERVDRFQHETKRYLDPDAEVVIPGFGYGSASAFQLQVQLKAAPADHGRLRPLPPLAGILISRGE